VAGHANAAAAAGASEILWLVGVDEKTQRLESADWKPYGDLGRWWKQVSSATIYPSGNDSYVRIGKTGGNYWSGWMPINIRVGVVEVPCNASASSI
jgi:hypothetical protein